MNDKGNSSSGEVSHRQQGEEYLSTNCEAMIKRAVVWYNAGGGEEQLPVVQYGWGRN
jgi:hypothetical protein